jgi:hypothetical protein
VPERPDRVPEVLRRSNERPEAHQKRRDAALEAASRADADGLSHQQTQVQCAGMQERALEDVVTPAQVHASHAPGPIEMCKRPCEALAPVSQQPVAPGPADASIATDRVARLKALPVAPPAIGLRNVGTHGMASRLTSTWLL